MKTQSRDVGGLGLVTNVDSEELIGHVWNQLGINVMAITGGDLT